MGKGGEVADSLGNRMKRYESAYRYELPIRTPVILRLDGKAFHTYTRGMPPFHTLFAAAMMATAKHLCKEVQGAELAYIQSDEISVLIHYYKRFTSQPWFDNGLQKMVSVASSVATAAFNHFSQCAGLVGEDMLAYFDCRAFTLPEQEVCNYFIWRQQDCTRNSIQILARTMYSHRECHNKNGAELQEMCFAKGKNWNDLPVWQKRGACVVRTVVEPTGDDEKATHTYDEHWAPPIFSQDRAYIETHMEKSEG